MFFFSGLFEHGLPGTRGWAAESGGGSRAGARGSVWIGPVMSLTDVALSLFLSQALSHSLSELQRAQVGALRAPSAVFTLLSCHHGWILG